MLFRYHRCICNASAAIPSARLSTGFSTLTMGSSSDAVPQGRGGRGGRGKSGGPQQPAADALSAPGTPAIQQPADAPTNLKKYIEDIICFR